MGFRIQGESGVTADVDADKQIKVVTNTDVQKAGAVRMYSVGDPGVVVSGGRILSPETSADYRMRVGHDTLLAFDTFNYANQNTAIYAYNSTTLTMAQASGRLVTNATGITTLSTGARMRSFQYFALPPQQAQLYVELLVSFSAAPATNTTVDIGLFLDGGSNPFAPTDGVYIRCTSAGVALIANFNTAETSSGPVPSPDDTSTVFSPTVDKVYRCLLAISEDKVDLWIDDVLLASVVPQTGQAQPFMSSSLPIAVRHAIAGVAAGSVFSLRVHDWSVMVGDPANYKPWSHQMSLAGGGNQVQQGATTGGQLTTYALGAAPAASTLTASTAPATNTLGGLFLLNATITAGESDYPLFAWLNPAGTSAIPGKNYVCTGIRVNEAFVASAFTGGPIVLTYAVGWGSTASSLATNESTTFTAGGTTKIARKEPLGVQAFAATAAAGTLAQGFQVDFSMAPKVIYPGQYLHIVLRCIGTNVTAGSVRGAITVMGYFE